MIPEPAQVARGCGILVLETGSHVGNEWGAQEGTGLCLDLKPARQSAGQNISQTILGPWRRPRHPPRDKVGLPLWWAASTRTGSVPGSGGSRWFCQYLHLPTPCLCMNSLFSPCRFRLLYVAHYQGAGVCLFFILPSTVFFTLIRQS